MSWEPDFDYDEVTGEKTIPSHPVSAIFQAIGSATRPDIWGPDGVFDEARATEIAEGLIAFLRAHPLAALAENDALCGCRQCEQRRKLQKRMRDARTARLALDPSLAAHGKRATYIHWGCRCEECCGAATQHQRERRARREADDAQDAHQVRRVAD